MTTLGSSPPADVVRLGDGTAVVVRPMRLTDVPALRRMGARLSPRSVYQRFMAPYPSGIPDGALEGLASVDHLKRDALVAIHRGEIVGVARYHSIAEREAELAVIVEDAWQRRGIGRALTLRVAALASERGIRRFSGTMLQDNRGAFGLLTSSFTDVSTHTAFGEREFTIEIPPTQVRRLRAG